MVGMLSLEPESSGSSSLFVLDRVEFQDGKHFARQKRYEEDSVWISYTQEDDSRHLDVIERDMNRKRR